MKTKITKESRNLLIGLLLGDGTISNNNVFKLSHCEQQQDYLEWKIKQLNNVGIRNNGLKWYTSSKGFNIGKKVCYTQLNVLPFIKVLRRVFYKPYKKIGNRKLLNRLSAKEIAIWYMDDGHINYRKTNNKIHGFYIKIATCLPKDELQVIIDYFKEIWNIEFYMFHEGKKQDSFSLCCGTKEGIKFINLVKQYVEQVPSMIHKIQYDLSQRTHAV
ncbi:MAG: hypothetical protein J6A25_06065 [Lachnospiraceae bacterium]|nr:hypothetical protein [Lachnospiraceae bacterium]